MTTAAPPPAPAAGPRERMVRSAMALVCRQGVSGTGLREVVAHAAAPRGSLQHYFPGGKEQLVGEALALAGATASRTVGRLTDAGAAFGPVAVLAGCGPVEVFSVATRVAARDRPEHPAPFAVTTVAVGADRTVRARGGLPIVADVLLADVLADGTTFDLVVVPGGVTTA